MGIGSSSFDTTIFFRIFTAAVVGSRSEALAVGESLCDTAAASDSSYNRLNITSIEANLCSCDAVILFKAK